MLWRLAYGNRNPTDQLPVPCAASRARSANGAADQTLVGRRRDGAPPAFVLRELYLDVHGGGKRPDLAADLRLDPVDPKPQVWSADELGITGPVQEEHQAPATVDELPGAILVN